MRNPPTRFRRLVSDFSGLIVVQESSTDLSGQEFSLEEFDIDFEFDAPRFYDFSRPELDSETEEIEIWFESAGNYPPSRFIYYNQTVKDVSKTKPKSKTRPSSCSTLTRPTASLLARQNKPLDIYSVQLLTRCQRSLGRFADNLSPILVSKLQNQDTKRQKLEAKVAQVNPNRRFKLTVPKEPNLRTAERSERHRSKVNPETEQIAKSRINSSKRNTTNKNINLELSSTPLPKSITPRSQDLQAFRLRTSLRAKERSINAKIDAIQENDATNSRKLKLIDSSKSRTLKGNHSKKINCQVYESNIFPLDSKRSSKEELGEASSIKYGTCRTDINRSLDLCRKFDSQEVTGSLIIA